MRSSRRRATIVDDDDDDSHDNQNDGNEFGDDFDDFEEGAQAGADDDFGDFDDGFQEPEAEAGTVEEPPVSTSQAMFTRAEPFVSPYLLRDSPLCPCANLRAGCPAPH